jgi:hypothetical protein
MIDPVLFAENRKSIAEIQNTWYDGRHGPKEAQSLAKPSVGDEMEVVYNLRCRGGEFFTPIGRNLLKSPDSKK